jgi:hypothetical protein
MLKDGSRFRFADAWDSTHRGREQPPRVLALGIFARDSEAEPRVSFVPGWSLRRRVVAEAWG